MVGMRTAAALVTVLVLSSSARADEWKASDTVLEAAVFATLAADYLQTRQLIRDGIETNPIMGTCGGQITLDGCGGVSPELYFAGVALLHAGAMRLLPAPWRHVAQGVTIGVEVNAIGRNYAWGYGVHF